MMSISRKDYPKLSKLPVFVLRLIVLALSPLVLTIALFTGNFVREFDCLVSIIFGKLIKVK